MNIEAAGRDRQLGFAGLAVFTLALGGTGMYGHADEQESIAGCVANKFSDLFK